MNDNGAPTILVVDDEEDVRTVLSARLQAAGFHVDTANTGMEALSHLRSATPDLIILDVMMPGIDGFRVCGLVKRDQRFNRVPIILLTARAQPQDKRVSKAIGADAYITKPFQSEALLGKIRELLDAKAPQPSAAEHN